MNATRIGLVLQVFVVSVAAIHAEAVTIETVPVGNPGNLPDVQPNGEFGAVDYGYRIGKFEVTNAQFAEFLNAVGTEVTPLTQFLYNADDNAQVGIDRVFSPAPPTWTYTVRPGYENRAVVEVSFLSAARFANWMHNGQPSGGMDATTTEDGAYRVTGITGGEDVPPIRRKPGARWFLPTEDEWYKAAYHKNDGPTGNYWDYATSSDTRPFTGNPPGFREPVRSNMANFHFDDAMPNDVDNGYAINEGFPDRLHVTPVGAYQHTSNPYGTFDQTGNVDEWTDSFVTSGEFVGDHFVRGASWQSRGFNPEEVSSMYRDFAFSGGNGRDFLGFRLATFVPEPSSWFLAVLAILTLGVWRRRISRYAATSRSRR